MSKSNSEKREDPVFRVVELTEEKNLPKRDSSDSLNVEFVMNYRFSGGYLVRAQGTKEFYLLSPEAAPPNKRGVQSVKKTSLKAVVPEDLEHEVTNVSRYFK